MVTVENDDTLAQLKQLKSEVGTHFDGDHLTHIRKIEVVKVCFKGETEELTAEELEKIYSFRLNLKECDL